MRIIFKTWGKDDQNISIFLIYSSSFMFIAPSPSHPIFLRFYTSFPFSLASTPSPPLFSWTTKKRTWGINRWSLSGKVSHCQINLDSPTDRNASLETKAQRQIFRDIVFRINICDCPYYRVYHLIISCSIVVRTDAF